MSTIETKLKDMSLHLPEAKPPVGNYLGCKKAGNLLFAAARVSDQRGEVGTAVTVAQAKAAARNTLLLILAIIKKYLQDLDALTGVVKLTGFVRSSPAFVSQPEVLDGASDLLVDLFGEAGRHARTATGVAQLPFGASVQLDIVFAIK